MQRPIITKHNVPQGTEEWHQARDRKFTGSNAYKLLGSFGATEYARAVRSNFSGNFYTKRGHILEDEALEIYEAINKVSVERPGWITNSHYPDCLYSPDGLDGEYLLEVKCFGEKPHMEIFNGDIPLKILAQIHYGMFLARMRKAKLIIYNPELDDKYAYKEIKIPFSRNINSNFKNILGGV